VNQNQSAVIATEPKQNGAPPGPALVIATQSLPLQRRVGPLAWTALQHLALRSDRTDQGWAVAVGVRDIAAGLGVTKDTAARAISVLVNNGLVRRGRVQSPSGHRRSGYLLCLPPPIRLIAKPTHPQLRKDANPCAGPLSRFRVQARQGERRAVETATNAQGPPATFDPRPGDRSAPPRTSPRGEQFASLGDGAEMP
jgi:hypothetical protein